MSIPSPQRYLVVHRPDKRNSPKYFGPFVSERMAYDFATSEFPPDTTVVRPLLSRQQNH